VIDCLNNWLFSEPAVAAANSVEEEDGESRIHRTFVFHSVRMFTFNIFEQELIN